jgi:hypothetical protein
VYSTGFFFTVYLSKHHPSQHVVASCIHDIQIHLSQVWKKPLLKTLFTKTYKPGLDINVCPIPVKTDVGQVDLVLRLSDGTSEKIGDSQTCRYDGQIYFHWYKILDLLYKRVLFDLQFVHILFWLKLKWNARSKLFIVSFIVPPYEVQGHWQN